MELWVDELTPVLEPKDYGRTEEATEILLRKLDAADLELMNLQGKVEVLQETGAKIEKLDHPNRCREFSLILEC